MTLRYTNVVTSDRFDEIFSPQLRFQYESILLYVKFPFSWNSLFTHILGTKLAGHATPGHHRLVHVDQLLLRPATGRLVWQHTNEAVTAWLRNDLRGLCTINSAQKSLCCRQTTQMQFLMTDVYSTPVATSVCLVWCLTFAIGLASQLSANTPLHLVLE